jgi:protein phosphatase
MQALRRILGLKPSKASQDDIQTAPLGKPATALPKSDANATKPLVSPEDGVTAPLVDNNGRTRQLGPLEEAVPMGGLGTTMIVGQRSDVGQVRDNNQDAMASFLSTSSSVEGNPNFGLFLVADGMGGHEDGEKASGFAARIVTKHVLKDIYLPMLTDGPGGDAEQVPMTDILRNAIQEANKYISTHVPDGGTTVTTAAIIGQLAYIGHVGDSRAYLINKDGIEQLTRDHSLVQRLIELGQLTPEEAAEHPQRNVLYRAIGQNEQLDVDAITRQLMPGSYLLICSDGLWNMVSGEELLTIVLNHGSNTQLACQTLVDLANERGGSDNITVVLVRIPE